MTTTAAPNRLTSFACEIKASSPSLREMELTIHLPCIHFNPAMMTSQLDESIMTGTVAISGSDPIRLRNLTISFLESSNPSSMLMSMTIAPSSTCLRAMDIASSYFFSLMSRRNLREPATLHRSPTLTNNVGFMTSSPLSSMFSSRGTRT